MSRARFLILWNCFLWVLVDCHQEVLRGINLKLFDQVLQWAQRSAPLQNLAMLKSSSRILS